MRGLLPALALCLGCLDTGAADAQIGAPLLATTATTFTPTGQFSAGGGALTITGNGIERVIGGLQVVNENFTIVATTLGTGTLQLNLPIASTNTIPVECASGNVSISGSTTVLPGSGTSLGGQVSAASTTVALTVQKTTGSQNITAALMIAGTTLTANLSCVID